MSKIDYQKILNQIKPLEEEKKEIKSLWTLLINTINETAQEYGINAEAVLVGSVAKGTWLSGKADIDIFIKFPLDTETEYLKEKGLYLGKECIKRMNGKYEYRYASHPYITGIIEGYEIDFVPCFHIKSHEELKSAVDRTIPHTKYVQENLRPEENDEVLLLKHFMKIMGTYGSEFKVGGFAGYLCELLIINYGTFLKTLKNASEEWKPGYIIDLMGYGTASLFTEPLVVVDPVDPKRNVAAALSLQKMSEFVAASRNFIKDQSPLYFETIEPRYDINSILEEFSIRGTKTLILSFKAPDIPADALYPQIKKTEKSIVQLAHRNGFQTFGSDYWTDETERILILLEFNIWKLPNIDKHYGPPIWSKDHQYKFLEKYKDNAWLEDDIWVAEIKRDYTNAKSLLEYALSENNINLLKFGKHIKDEIINQHEIKDLLEVLKLETVDKEVLKFLYSYLHKNKGLLR